MQPLQCRLTRDEVFGQRQICLASDPDWRLVDDQGVKLVDLVLEQQREQRLHLLFLSAYSDKLDLCEFLLIARFYHLSEEVVDYLPWLVCFHGFSI